MIQSCQLRYLRFYAIITARRLLCGKSTFYHEHLTDRYVRVNLDTLKTRHQDNLLVAECIRQSKGFAVDNTNPTRAGRQRYIPLAQNAGYRIAGYFMESKIKDCVERDNKRTGKERLPAKAFAATSNKLQPPLYDEGFDGTHFVENDGRTMAIENGRE